ncbi:beta-ketoacyl-ACP synthase [Pseudochrobactrum sp. MP213Fo]|uniref:beta-ketoacyl-ACP synthase n=1 Tax=Pseudochrobactrum sp. MP213Fo TaxID=3022250 RepID=UPI003BA2E1FB
MHSKKVLITGIGLITSLGEGVETHWAILNGDTPQPKLDTENFAPYTVHPLGEVDWSQQIPKRSDQRQMETWQRLGTYAAGLALQDAGIKDNAELCSTMDMIVSAGGGERDISVDTQILGEARGNNNPGILLNEKLSTELRPTLFLAQLSNLLAGNISIVHKVTGSSRTFMGEEGSGISAVETAAARIRTGQSTHALVGGSYNAEHFDMLLGHELGGYLKSDGWAPVWSRESSAGGGMITGSGGIFLVLEEAEHAQARGARAYGEIASITSGQIRRETQDLTTAIADLIEDNSFVVSGASGAHKPTTAEKAALTTKNASYRGVSSLFGHMRESQFPLALALAALSVWKGEAFAPFTGDEPARNGALTSATALTIGAARSEGAAKIIKV